MSAQQLITDGDKATLLSGEETSDSGFISSGNLLLSSEDHINSSEEEEKQPMRLDSGVNMCLSQLSNLSLTKGLNDLNKPGVVVQEKDIVITKQPWEIYYEQDEDGDTHLHIAISQGFPEVALALIRLAPHPRLLDTLNDHSQSPLHLSVLTEQWLIARWLIVAGARPSPRNLHGDSPLHIAAAQGDLLSCRALTNPVQQKERDWLGLTYPQTPYQPCALDQWNYDGQTSIHVAAWHGHVDVLRHLVWHGADINAREGTEGLSALHMAVKRNNADVIKFLLGECRKINVHVTTYGGRNALQLGYPLALEMVELIRQRGVSTAPFDSSDDEEETDSDEDEELYYEKSQPMTNATIINASA